MSVTRVFGRMFRKTAIRDPRQVPAGRRLTLEPLEERAVPTGLWIGPAGGNWSNPANWSTGLAPQPGAVLTFGGTNTDSVADVSVSVEMINCTDGYSAKMTISEDVTVNSGFWFIHRGTLDLRSNCTIIADRVDEFGAMQANGTNSVITAATVQISDGSITVIAPGLATPNLTINGNLFQAGPVVVGVGPGSHLKVNGGWVIDASTTTNVNTTSRVTYTGAGPVEVEGVLTLMNASFNASPGIDIINTLTTIGLSRITGAVQNNGTVNFGGSTPGVLSITGAYNQSTLGALNMRVFDDFGSNGFDTLGATTANILGSLNITKPGGFIPGTPGFFFSRNMIVTTTGLSFGASVSFPAPHPLAMVGWAFAVDPLNLTISHF